MGRKQQKQLFLFVGLLLGLTIWQVSAHEDTPVLSSSPKISVETATGNIVCNASAAFAQLPGRTDLFVGRGLGIGSLDYCHRPHPDVRSFLALFRMDWKSNKMLFLRKLLDLPDKPKPGITTPTGVCIEGAIDPCVVSYRGEQWVAFEALAMGTDCSCVAPLTPDMKGLDLSRLTVVVKGENGPLGALEARLHRHHGGRNQIVCIHSSSTPWLLNFRGHLYIYWTDDSFFNELSEYPLVSRGMELVEDDRGRLWGKGSGGRPVNTTDPRLTCQVKYLDKSDPTANHVAHLRSAYVVRDKILAFFTVGGTIGNQVCCSPHQTNAGCWRLVISIAKNPLGENAFAKNIVDMPSLPCNRVEYPRIIVDPSGHNVLLGYFQPPNEIPGRSEMRPVIPDGLRYIPVDSMMSEALRTN